MGYANHALRTARERMPSRIAPGEPLSRAELAEAVNAWLWRETGRRYALDHHAVARWERGRVRWPNAPYRAALRAVLAARLARSGNDVAFGAVALSALARLQFDLGAPDDGLGVVALAQRGTRRTASPRLTSTLATREAWGHAQIGDVRRFHSAVDSALDAHGEVTADDPASLHGFDAAELHGTVGARYRDMARHDRRYADDAARHVRVALELRAPDRTRNRAFDLVSLARVQLIAREPDGSAESVRSALAHFDVHRPGRLGRKLADWVRESEQFRTVPVVAEVRDEITQLTSTARNVT